MEKFFICMMKISVLIPTYNRRDWLLKTLNCVGSQTYQNFEVIIVDASQPEDQLNDAELLLYSFQIKYLRYGILGNVSKQRNIALKEATGDILLFLDDDVTFDKNLFLNYQKLFSGGKYEAISGLVETEKFKRGSGPIRNLTNRFLDIGRENYQPCDFEIKSYVICTANFALLRKVYEQVGGFDEKIYGVFDDVDYGFTLERFDISVVHHPEVAVYHHQTKANGARSSALPPWWFYYNISYFQLKNRNLNAISFFIIVSWQMIKPSGSWLVPKKLVVNYKNFINGFFRARKSVFLGEQSVL